MNELEFYRALYKSADMGYDAVNNLMPKVSSEHLRRDMARHMDGYVYFGNIAKEKLEEAHESPEREPGIKKVPAKIGMSMHTMFDSSPAHIAELMINGSNMSILDMQKKMNRLHEHGGCEEAEGICRRMMDFEADNIKRMQKYV